MHIFIGYTFVSALYVLPKINNDASKYGGIFLYNLLFSLVLRCLFLDYTNDPYEGTASCDIYTYERLALKGLDKNFFDYMGSLLTSQGISIKIDDLGFISVMVLFYKTFADISFVRILFLVINATLITVSSFKILKICNLLSIDKEISNYASILYGIFPFWFVSSSMGLKENLFCFLIVSALYNIYLFKETNRVRDFLTAFIFISFTYFFRSIICLFLFIIFVLYMYCNEKNKKTIILLSSIGAIIGIIFINVIVLKFTGYSMDVVSATTASRMNRSVGSGFFGWLTQLFAAFYGPFPNFTRMGQYGFYYSSGLLFKSIISLFVNVGLFSIVKNLEWRLYPLVFFLLMGYFMIIISGVSLDIRYHITFFAPFVIIFAYVFEQISLRLSLINLHTCMIILLVLLYNLR